MVQALAIRWLRTLSEEDTRSVERAIGHKGYSWTGWTGARYGLQLIWELRIYNISASRLLLVDSILAPYALETPL